MSATHDSVLHLMPAPVVVIGAAAGGATAGLTAAWITRVSTEPPLVAVAVAPDRHTHGLLVVSDLFTVSVLRPDQVEEGRLFGLRSGREVDKWRRVDHVLLEGGTPALASCAGRLCCRVVARLETGDHEVFVGEILESEMVDGGLGLAMKGSDWAPRK